MVSNEPDGTRQEEKLLLIDCNALLYRSFFALPPLTTKSGVPTGAVYGFAKGLSKLLAKEEPAYIACAWDKGRETFRHKVFKDYKATRPKTPNELLQQIPYAKEILAGLNMCTLEHDNYEADDIIATLALQAEASGFQVDIYTGDKDILQIVSPLVRVIRFLRGFSLTETLDVEGVKKRFGVEPGQMGDYLALVGDQSDNIPGVTGIGPKTATSLLHQFGSIDKILARKSELPASIVSKINNSASQLKLARKLVPLVTSVPLSVDLEDLRWGTPDSDRLFAVLEQLESRDLLKSFSRFRRSVNETTINDDAGRPEGQTTPTEPSMKNLWIVDINQGELPSQLEISLSSNSHHDTILVNTQEKAGNIQALRPLEQVVSLSKAIIVAHDTKPLVQLLMQRAIELKATLFDITLAAYVLDSSRTDYELSTLADDFLKSPPAELQSVSARIQCMQQLYPVLKQQLQESKAWDLLVNIELPLIPILLHMELKGIRVDKERLQSILEEVEAKRKKLQAEIYVETGQQFNINSPQQLAHVLFDELGLPVVKRTRTGASTSESSLRRLADSYPYLETILMYRHLTKLASTYLKPLREYINPKTGRVYTSFRQISTSTGRLSSCNPNLQNIPVRDELGQRIRKAFIADKGHLLLSADYSQIELRILAHLSGDARLISAFQEGRDIHQETASEIFDVLPLKVTAQMRRQAKIVNFGIIYGMSPFGLARDLNTPQDEAAQFIERYFERYPGVKTYIEATLRDARENGFVSTLMGRRRYLPDIRSTNTQQRTMAERMAVNSPIQGTAADLVKIAMLRVHTVFQNEHIPAWIVLQIHDELLIEVYEQYLEQVRTLVREEMQQAMRLEIPMLVNIKIGSNWAEMNN